MPDERTYHVHAHELQVGDIIAGDDTQIEVVGILLIKVRTDFGLASVVLVNGEFGYQPDLAVHIVNVERVSNE